MKRIISVLAVMTIMAAMVVATAAPAFAKSFASDSDEFGPSRGSNYGHCKGPVGPGNGNTTAEFNPSYNGGPTNADGGELCSKQ